MTTHPFVCRRDRHDDRGGRGRGGGGRDRGGPVLSHEEANLRRLRQYIITNDGMDHHLPQLVDVLKQELQLYGTAILDTILDCAAEMPVKTGVYATLVRPHRC